LAPFVSFWSGALGWMELLCIHSMLRHGHRLAIYSYEPLVLPHGVELRDARTIILEGSESHALIKEQVAAFADVFRYRLMQQGLGIWVDLDLYFLKPYNGNGSVHIFGWEKPGRVNNAFLLLPSKSPVLDDLIEFTQQRPLFAPWWRPKHKLRQRLAIAFGRPLPLSAFPKAQFGPKALTYFLGKHDLLGEALRSEVVYPVAPQDNALLVGPAEAVSSLITSDTIAVHLWASGIKSKLGGLMPASSSFLGQLIEKNKRELA
jgi:hypothetical protein